MTEVSGALNEVIEQAGESTLAAPAKRVRAPKLDAEGNAIVKAPKAPKMYPQYNEDGSVQTNEDGTPVMGLEKMKKPKAAKPAKLDADGNPIVRARVVPSNEGAVLTINAEKIAKYKGARADNAKMLEDGMTIGDFVAAGGDRGFLRFYVRDGAVAVAE